MAIFAPGQKFRRHKLLSRNGNKRSVAASLSLTAMVDMFTVIVIFLLQNYDPQTKAVLYIPENVDLPSANRTDSLKPAIAITLSETDVMVDAKKVMTTQQAKTQQDWMLAPLFEEARGALQAARQKEESQLAQRIRANLQSRDQTPLETGVPAWSRVTLQADRSIDFLTVKKIMFTLTEAGAGQINFAVTKDSVPN